MKTISQKTTGLPLVRALLAIGAILLFGVPAQAATDSWTGATSASWNANNWTGGNAIPVSGDSLIFGSTTGGFTTLSDNLMTPVTFTVNGITFSSGAAAFIINPNTAGVNGFTLAGGITNSSTSLETINDLITISGTQTITTLSGGGNITLGGVISGGGLTEAGSGTLTLSGQDTYTGTTTVTSGVMVLASTGSLSSPSLVIGSSGTFQLGNSTAAANQTFTSLMSAAGTADMDGGNATTTGTLTLNTSATDTYSGTIGSSATGGNNIAVLMTGGGQLILSAASTGTGGVIISSGTVTGTSSANAFGAAGNLITIGNANTGSGTATLALAGGVTYANPITVSAAAGSNATLIITNTNSVAPTLNGTLNVANNLTIDATGGIVQITSGSMFGSGNITTNSSGAGSVKLAIGNQTGFSGTYIVNSGSTNFNSQKDINNEVTVIAVNLGAQAGWQAGTGNNLAGIVNGANGGGLFIEIGSDINLGSPGNYSFSGTLSYPGNTFNKVYSGTQTFSGPIIMNAGSNIKDGTLLLSTANSGSMSMTQNMTVGVGGSQVDNSGTGNATLLISGNYTIYTNNSGLTVKSGTNGTTSAGIISLSDGSGLIHTLTISSTSSGDTVINFNGNGGQLSYLAMDVGNNTADEILATGPTAHINTPGTSGQMAIILNGIGGITSAGSAALLNATSTGIQTGAVPTLSATTGNFSGVTSLSLTQASTSITVNWSAPTAAPATAYWDNAAPSGSGTWATLTGGTLNYSNWSSSSSGTVNTLQVPGPATNVVFNGENSTLNASVSLNAVSQYNGTTFSINSGSFLSGAGAVTITGTNALTVGAGGLTVSSGSNDTISAPVALGSPQTWTVSSGTLSVTGSLSGANGLAVTGPGTVVLSGNNGNFTGGLTINSGTVILSRNNSVGATFQGSISGCLSNCIAVRKWAEEFVPYPHPPLPV